MTSRTRTKARLLQAAVTAQHAEAWNNPAPSFDPFGDQRSYEPDRAAHHLASLSDERLAELEWKP